MQSLKENGYILIETFADCSWFEQLRHESESLERTQFEHKNIQESVSQDANQRRFELINPPLLTEIYRSRSIEDLIRLPLAESLKPNHRCGYYVYFEGSYIEPHFDHLLSDCMLLICLNRKYGQGRGGVLKLYLPKVYDFEGPRRRASTTPHWRIQDIDLKAGSGILLAGGHILHECTPVEKRGMRLVCGMGYLFQRHMQKSRNPESCN